MQSLMHRRDARWPRNEAHDDFGEATRPWTDEAQSTTRSGKRARAASSSEAWRALSVTVAGVSRPRQDEGRKGEAISSTIARKEGAIHAHFTVLDWSCCAQRLHFVLDNHPASCS